MPKNKQFIPIYFDVMFKFLFGTNKNVRFTESLLESFFSLKPGSLKGTEIRNSVVLDKDTVLNRKYELDILAELPDGTLVNIEMQQTYDDFDEKRIFTYLNGMLYTNLNKGENMNNIKRTISITLTNNLKIHKNNLFIQEYNMTNTKISNDKIMENDYKSYIVDVEHTCEYNGNDLFKHWTKYIGSKNLETLRENSKLKEIIKDALKECEIFMDLDYVQNSVIKAKLRKWAEDARREKEDEELRTKAITSGLKQGLEQGLQQGLQQGEKNKMYEIAKNFLLNTDDSLETISLCTGLSLCKLKKLKKELEEHTKKLK